MPPGSPGTPVLALRRPVPRAACQVGPRGDAELAVDLPQVVLDGAGADEQVRGNLPVPLPLTGEAGDVGLLGSQHADRVDAALPGLFTGGPEPDPGAFGECIGTHVSEHVVSSAELGTRIASPQVVVQQLVDRLAGIANRAGAREQRERFDRRRHRRIRWRHGVGKYALDHEHAPPPVHPGYTRPISWSPESTGIT
jgi:hypothetical protein